MIAARRHPSDVGGRWRWLVLPADAVDVIGRHTGGVKRALADRWRAAGAALRRSGPPLPALSRWAWVADVALALFLAAVTVYSATRPTDTGPFVVFPPPPPLPPPVHLDVSTVPVPPGEALLAALTAVPLIVRRRFPLVAFWAVLLATLVFNAERDGISNNVAALTLISCLIAGYSAVTYSPYRARAIVSLVIGAVLLAIRHDTTIPDCRRRIPAATVAARDRAGREHRARVEATSRGAGGGRCGGNRPGGGRRARPNRPRTA